MTLRFFIAHNYLKDWVLNSWFSPILFFFFQGGFLGGRYFLWDLLQSFDFNLRFFFFVLFSTGGIMLMGYADGFKGVNAVGVIFCAGLPSVLQYIRSIWYESCPYINVYIRSLCFDFSVVQCSIHRTRARYKIKSPDEWVITKQACRDESIVSSFFLISIYIYIYMH